MIIDLDITELNYILETLAKQPWEQVALLIEKIREQAIPQLPTEEETTSEEVTE